MRKEGRIVKTAKTRKQMTIPDSWTISTRSPLPATTVPRRPRETISKKKKPKARAQARTQARTQAQMQIHEYSYSDIGGKVEERERDIRFEDPPGKAVVRTRRNGKEEVRELTKKELQRVCNSGSERASSRGPKLKELMGTTSDFFCDAFLSSGLPCPHPPKFLQIAGGQDHLVCGYHRR